MKKENEVKEELEKDKDVNSDEKSEGTEELKLEENENIKASLYELKSRILKYINENVLFFLFIINKQLIILI